MNKLDMIKAFAEFEGVELQHFMVDFECFADLNGKSYNPITDLAFTMQAMIDYEVNVDNYSGYVFMDSEYTDGERLHVVSFCVDSDMPRAIIECILKSEGRWV